MPQSLLAATTDPNLAETAAALTRWRSTKPLGARIPEALWSRAADGGIGGRRAAAPEFRGQYT